METANAPLPAHAFNYEDNAVLRLLHDSDKPYVTFSAPMVRISKLPWRMLVRRHGCDVAYSQMIVAESFAVSHEARVADFQTSAVGDRPLVVQLAARDSVELSSATRILSPYVDGIGINCGCPQSWAIKQGYGCGLGSKAPEYIADMVRQARNVGNIPIECKIRVFANIRRTVDLVQQLEHAGVGWITVHGRTQSMRPRDPVLWESVRTVRENLTIPVVHNGDVFSRADADFFAEQTGCRGIMAGRGLLSNPALFDFQERLPCAPLSVIREFLDLSFECGIINMEHFHHALQWMMEPLLTSVDRKEFQQCFSPASMVSFLEDRSIIPRSSF
jgi:tRNA-dihydrouridine synthase 4